MLHAQCDDGRLMAHHHIEIVTQRERDRKRERKREMERETERQKERET